MNGHYFLGTQYRDRVEEITKETEDLNWIVGIVLVVGKKLITVAGWLAKKAVKPANEWRWIFIARKDFPVKIVQPVESHITLVDNNRVNLK